jgi:Protein of unknown function (DUF1552)
MKNSSFHRSSPPLSRRNFLRGVGACIALPAMASLFPRRLLAERMAAQLATTATGAPLRTAFITFPNGAIPGEWWPTGGLTSFELKSTLQPLAAMRNHIQVLGGLDQVNAQPRGDGGGDHARGQSVFLTGVRLNKSAVDVRAGVSIDQVIASQVAPLTRFSSLEMTCDSSRKSAICDSGYSCAYQYNVSWKSATTPMPPENNPRVIFERLFGAGTHGERAANAQARLMDRRSVLDFVLDDTQRLNRQLGRKDQEKLDQYLTGLRDVERRIQQSEQFGPNVDPDLATPAGIPASHVAYVDLMLDMLLLAFQTDSTRVATLMLAHDGDNRSFSEIGISEGHHDLSHHKHEPERVRKVAQIERWYVERFAGFLSRMEATRDVDGHSLLHNSRILYGSGNADANIHTHVNLPLVLAGSGGGLLTPGRFVQHDSKPLTNLYLTLADQAGMTGLERFGDSTGRLGNI